MYNLRNELIKSIINSLKIDNNPFNTITIQELISKIDDNKLQEFYQKLFGAEHAYLNGIDRVAKVAESFKPVQFEDDITRQAKELIALVHSMNNQIFDDAKKMGVPFDDLLEAVQFPNIDEETIHILNQVKPHYNLKSLVGNINTYQTSLEQIRAFKDAITQDESISLAIENKAMNNLRIKR